MIGDCSCCLKEDDMSDAVDHGRGQVASQFQKAEILLEPAKSIDSPF